MIDSVFKIAKRCRDVSEIFVVSEDAKDYDFYNPEKKEIDLSCFCACASIFLQQRLKENGIEASAVKGNIDNDDVENHCWVELKDKTIVDITATQFSYGRCHEVLITTYYKHPNYKKFGDCSSIQNLRGWPPSQKPDKAVLKKLELLYNAIPKIKIRKA